MPGDGRPTLGLVPLDEFTGEGGRSEPELVMEEPDERLAERWRFLLNEAPMGIGSE